MLLWTLRCMYPCPYTHVYQGYPPCVFFQSTFHILGFPGGSDSKESTCNVGDLGSIPGSGRSLGGGHGNPLQYSGLENPMNRGEPGRLQSMGSQRVRHDWVTKHTHQPISPYRIIPTSPHLCWLCELTIYFTFANLMKSFYFLMRLKPSSCVCDWLYLRVLVIYYVYASIFFLMCVTEKLNFM